MKVLFMGSKELGLKCLKKIAEMDKTSEIIVITIDDRKDEKSNFKEWIHFAKNRNLRLIVSKNRLDAERMISEIQPEIAFVVGWYWLIDAILLKAVHKGFIGVHNSLLPNYRGWAPVSWAMMNGEREIGVSLFRFSDQMDDGPIYAQKKIRTSPEWYLDDSLKSLESATLTMLEETYFSIMDGTLEPKPQEGIPTYGARRRPQHSEIDWSADDVTVDRFIHANSSPYPEAFTVFKTRKLLVQKSRLENETWFGRKGEVVRKSANGVTVICGNNRAIFLEGMDIPVGTVFPDFSDDSEEMPVIQKRPVEIVLPS